MMCISNFLLLFPALHIILQPEIALPWCFEKTLWGEFQENSRVVSNNSESLRFRIQALENNNLGGKKKEIDL